MSSSQRIISVFLVILCIAVSTRAFTILPSTSNGSSIRLKPLREGQMEQIEFRIYPDGRVEETVRGIKGGECHKVTDEINKHLGKVVSSRPTEEMYEQEITIDQKINISMNEKSGGWEGSSSW